MAMHVGVLRGRAIGGARPACQAKPHTLVTIAAWCNEEAMASDGRNTVEPASMTREERLAAQLRANLRRRKAQARATANGGADPDDQTAASGQD